MMAIPTSAARVKNRRVKNRAGSGMVETALVLLVLLSMILFTMEMGRVLLIQQFIAQRARATVRMSVVNNWDASAVKNYFCFNQTTAPQGASTGFLGVAPSQVNYTALGTAGSNDYRLQVSVSGVKALALIPYIAGQYTLAPVVATMPAQSLGATD